MGYSLSKIELQEYLLFNRSFVTRLAVFALLLAFTAGCAALPVASSAIDKPGAAATTTVVPPTDTPIPTNTPKPTPTQLLLQQTPTVLPLIGPVPYPTPQAEIIPWDQLINQALIQNVSWSQYQGEIQANEKGLLWPYTFQYPSDWYLTANPNPTHVFVQNIPESQGAPQGDFAKFEILRLKEPPLLESEPPNSQDFRTITIAEERGVVTVLTQIPGKSRTISAVFQHKGVWFAISGYITLPTESIENLERYTAMLLSMLASFTLEGSS